MPVETGIQVRRFAEDGFKDLDSGLRRNDVTESIELSFDIHLTMPIDLVSFANVIISGILTGLVYGLMALGLSVIFGVARVVNFAHGEMMTLAMYASVILFSTFELNPFIAVLPVAAFFFVLGYGLQRWIVNPFVTRPDHAQFMLLLSIAIILTNGQLIILRPRRAQRAAR